MKLIVKSVLLLSFIMTGVRTQKVMRICEENYYHPAKPLTVSCPAGQVLKIHSAFWGRSHPAIAGNNSPSDNYCPSSGVGDDQTSCAGHPNDALSRLRDLCEDEESCQIRPAAIVFGWICRDIYKYLEFTYSCTHLECTCSLNGTTLALDVFDEPDLMVYSTGQKTILSSYKLTENDPCKFKFLSVTSGNTAPAPLTAIIFNVGKHPKNAKKFYRSYKITQTSIKERGVGKKQAIELTLPHCWTGPNQETDICIERVGNVIQFRSTKCPYALDVDVGSTPLSGTLYIEKSVNWPLMGMCGDCDDQFNGYVLADGTSVDNVPDEQERFRLITKSYLSSKARRR